MIKKLFFNPGRESLETREICPAVRMPACPAAGEGVTNRYGKIS